MIDLSNVTAIALGADDVLEIQDSLGTVLWQKIIYYTVNISAGSNGTVSVNGVSGNYSQSVPSGTVLTIQGTGDTGYDFDQWSDGNTDNPRTITVTGNLTLTAAFESVVTDEYFWIENISGSSMTVTIKKNNKSAPTITVYKSSDQTTWTSMGTTSTTGITATVSAGRKMYFKCTAAKWAGSNLYRNLISANQNHNVGGNIMSLLYDDNYQNYSTVYSYAFSTLFATDSYLINTSKLKLPATTIGDYCYHNMFKDCTSLTTSPVILPATSVNTNSYYGMFQGCTALTTAPELPATTVQSYSCANMFNGCTSLTTSPALPATTLDKNSYYGMFQGCTSLTTAPELPATTLTQSCYSSMFSGCSSLNRVTTYANDISANSCVYNWLQNVSAQGDFFNLGNPAPTYPSGVSGIPQGWTEHTSL